MKNRVTLVVFGGALIALSLKPAPPFIASNVYASPSGVINIEVDCPTQSVPELALTVPAGRTVIVERVTQHTPGSSILEMVGRAYVVRAGGSADLTIPSRPNDPWALSRIVLSPGDQLYVSASLRQQAGPWVVRIEGTWE